MNVFRFGERFFSFGRSADTDRGDWRFSVIKNGRADGVDVEARLTIIPRDPVLFYLNELVQQCFGVGDGIFGHSRQLPIQVVLNNLWIRESQNGFGAGGDIKWQSVLE